MEIVSASEQRDRALMALRRIGISVAEIAEVTGASQSYVRTTTKGIEPRKLHCCHGEEEHIKVIGRQFGYGAEPTESVEITRTKVP